MAVESASEYPTGQSTRRRLLAGVIVLVALAGLVMASLAAVAPPAPVAGDAPADSFSATRAYWHVERVGSQQHVTGSPAAADVRHYIVSTLTGFGLQPQIQDTISATDQLSGPYGMARVRNVVAVLPGETSTGRIVMFAHYDSVQVSYGGNDDGAGVSTLLETARVLAAGPRPRNDIVFLFTDAEEACLCGAQAFVDQSPLAAQGGVAMNFESRGSSGPVVLFETSRGNANVVGVYADAVPYPVATSFAVEIYRILPNDTDFTPFRDSGRFSGLNSAYIDGSAVYHAPEDRPSYMDQASLQQHGDDAVALARSFGAADIAALTVPAANDSTYFPVLSVLLRYPGWLVWPLAILALLAVVGLAVLARRRGLTSWPRGAAGLGLAVVPLILAPVAAQLLWALLVALRPGYANMIDPWWPGWFRACVVALVLTIVLAWYGLLRRPIGAWSLAIGAFGLLAVLGLVLAAVTPGGSYLASLPALAGATGSIVAVSAGRFWLRVVVLGAAAAVAVVILAPTVALFFPALGLATGAAGAFFAVLLGLALLPVFELVYPTPEDPGSPAAQGQSRHPGFRTARRRLWAAIPAMTAGALALAFLGAGLAVDHFDADHPAPAQLFYALDADSGQARWLSTDSDPGEWVSQYVTGPEDLRGTFGLLGVGVLTGPAQPAALPAPALTVSSDSTSGDRRNLSITVTPQREVRLIYLLLPGAAVARASVAGHEIPTSVFADGTGVVFNGPPDRDTSTGVTFDLELDEVMPVTARVIDGSDGLDELPGFTPRPPGVGVQGSHTSELVLVAKTYTV